MKLADAKFPVGAVLLLWVVGSLAVAADEDSDSDAGISVCDFGAVPDDGENDAQPLRKAAEYARTHPGVTLHFPPGHYDFSDPLAVEIMEKTLAGEYGKDPQTTIFRPYFPYVKALDFNGAKDLTIDANGARLVIDGWLEPVSLENCRNVVLRGLTIDYKRAPYSVGEVVATGRGYLDVRFSARYPIREGTQASFVNFWNHKERRLAGNTEYGVPTEVIGQQLVRLRCRRPRDSTGFSAIIRHTGHFRPAIFIHNAQNTTLENVTIHTQPGMGVLGHRSENITLKGLRVVPRAGELAATTADATHFVSCTGLIRLDGCQFEGQGDDTTNVHNYYYEVVRLHGETGCEIQVNTSYGTHAQVLDYPSVGDKLELVERNTCAPLDVYVVKSVENFPELWKTSLVLDKRLPKDIGGYYLSNISRLPRVEIRNCHIRNHRARGLLIKTRNVLIEGCTIESVTGSGIQVGPEESWREGTTTADLVVRNNRILGCGYGDGTIKRTAGVVVTTVARDPTRRGLHKRILIEGNQIICGRGRHGIRVDGAEDVVIRYNEIAGCKEPIKVEYSDNVQIYANESVPPRPRQGPQR